MEYQPAFTKVPLPDLAGEAQYRLSFFRPLEPLLKSIQAIGQTTPILCRQTKNGLELFSGFQRRDALRKLRKKTALALVFDAKEMSEARAFRIAFFENACTRGLNPAEQAKAAQRLKELGVGDLEIARSFFSEAGLGVGVNTIGLLRNLFELDREWKQYLTEKDLSLKHLAWFLRLPREDQATLKFLLKLRPTASQLRQVLEMIEEVQKRDQIQLERILKAIAAPKLEPVLAKLRELRYPQFVKLSSRHRKLLRELKIPAEAKLEPADFFEGPEYRLQISLDRGKDALKIFEQLLQAAAGPDWQKLFELDED